MLPNNHKHYSNALAKKLDRIIQWALEEEERTLKRVGGIGCRRRGSNAGFSG